VSETSLTAYVASFTAHTRASDIPDEVFHFGKRSILDGLGLALCGATSQASRLIRQHLRSLSCNSDEAAVLGSDLRLAPRFAALANGTSIHADDYDDTQLAVAKDRVYGLLTHPTAPVLPAVLALGERDHRSGQDVLAAYLVGVEVETKIAEAIHPSHYQQGFHTTATCGPFGACAGAANLLGFDVETTLRALGIAASQSAGLRENFGTMVKPLHAGRASESGVVASQLAPLGYTASPVILEAERGFFQAAGGGYEASMINEKLGHPWTFVSPGVSIKPHPCGSLTHPAMGVMLDLIHRHDIRADQVVRVSVGTNQNMPNALIHHRPLNSLQAKFSMEFCVAILLLERKAGLAEFTDEVVNRSDVQALIQKVDFGVHAEAEAAGYEKMTTLIEIELESGETVPGQADFAKGSPVNPMSDQELSDKFCECASWGGVPKARQKKALELIWRLDELADIGEIIDALSNQQH
jgi:2-methylcitrate dehydratase PrpD